MPGNPPLPTENIDSVILRLLRISSGTELDYQTYFKIIVKRLALNRMTGSKVPPEEDQLLRDELKRVSKLKDKGRFKVQEKKVKVSTPPPPSPSRGPGPKGGGGGGKPPKSGSIVKSQKGQITTERFFYQIPTEKVKVTEKTTRIKKDKDCLCLKELQSIDKKLDSVVESLIGIDKENRKRSEKERKDLEEKSRLEKEKGLEARPFDNIKKAIKSMLKPFESVWDILKNFIFNIILGRIVVKLLDWFSKKENQEKFNSVIKFLGKHWPVLLALYLRFGTGLGRFIGFLSKTLIKGAIKIAALAARLAVKAGIGKAGGKLSKVAKFLGGKRGAALATGLTIATDVAMTAATSKGLENLGGGDESKTEPTQNLAGGGRVRPRFPAFAGGGFNFKGMLGGASTGAMFGPLGMLLGGAFGSGKPQQMVNGFVSGQKGVDKVPAMLSDGEFVMSAGAVKKYGVETLEAMNAAGGGTNKPKITNGKTYAVTGGPIGRSLPSKSEGQNSDRSLRDHINAFFRGHNNNPNFDIGNPSTWRGGPGGGGTGTSVSGGGGTGAFLRGMGYAGRAAGQVPRIANNVFGPTLSYAQRAAGQAGRMAAPTVARAQKVAAAVRKKVDPALKGIPGMIGKTVAGFNKISSPLMGATQEALPAVLNSVLGRSVTDTSISEDMQRQILQARQTALKKGRNKIEYEDYAGGGRFSAGGLTMGRIGDSEFKRDAKGRIIGLRQVYDTDTTVKKAMDAAGSDWKKFGSSINLFKGKFDPNMHALMGGIYKPVEALLAASQGRGKTLHDINFDEKVLGFKPGKEVLNQTQKNMIAAQKNREALQNKRPWWDKMGLFGGASAQIKKEQMNPQSVGKQGPTITRRTTASPVKPPVKQTPKVVVVNTSKNNSSNKKKSGPPTHPSFSASHGKTNTAKKTLGVK